ncbi:unnamed protein product [Eruca vesicaria subsp. sativa]|uniref:Maturase K n=1 Tax=Eruca vesicaria subsp. sativa TaxID=29727 RepID=A0ABC8L8R5_ERUVS|nr:unnamed protein product [Eruca vesicaria subsp. sativa]
MRKHYQRDPDGDIAQGWFLDYFYGFTNACHLRMKQEECNLGSFSRLIFQQRNLNVYYEEKLFDLTLGQCLRLLALELSYNLQISHIPGDGERYLGKIEFRRIYWRVRDIRLYCMCVCRSIKIFRTQILSKTN